jgi:hypothetical protein
MHSKTSRIMETMRKLGHLVLSSHLCYILIARKLCWHYHKQHSVALELLSDAPVHPYFFPIWRDKRSKGQGRVWRMRNELTKALGNKRHCIEHLGCLYLDFGGRHSSLQGPPPESAVALRNCVVSLSGQSNFIQAVNVQPPEHLISRNRYTYL